MHAHTMSKILLVGQHLQISTMQGLVFVSNTHTHTTKQISTEIWIVYIL